MKKFIAHFCGIMLSILALLGGSCALVTPTTVPPLTETLGYHVPNYKGVTTVGLVKGTLEVERARLMTFDKMATISLQATEQVKTGIMDILALVGMGGTALIPLALKKVPRGAVSKAEHERLVKKALKMNPPTV